MQTTTQWCRWWAADAFVAVGTARSLAFLLRWQVATGTAWPASPLCGYQISFVTKMPQSPQRVFENSDSVGDLGLNSSNSLGHVPFHNGFAPPAVGECNQQESLMTNEIPVTSPLHHLDWVTTITYQGLGVFFFAKEPQTAIAFRASCNDGDKIARLSLGRWGLVGQQCDLQYRSVNGQQIAVRLDGGEGVGFGDNWMRPLDRHSREPQSYYTPELRGGSYHAVESGNEELAGGTNS
jgi:hypothetical protein